MVVLPSLHLKIRFPDGLSGNHRIGSANGMTQSSLFIAAVLTCAIRKIVLPAIKNPVAKIQKKNYNEYDRASESAGRSSHIRQYSICIMGSVYRT